MGYAVVVNVDLKRKCSGRRCILIDFAVNTTYRCVGSSLSHKSKITNGHIHYFHATHCHLEIATQLLKKKQKKKSVFKILINK